MKKIGFAVTACLLILAAVETFSAYGQEEDERRTVGLSASLQSSQLDILLPFWVGKKIVLAPAFQLIHVEDGGTDLAFGVAPRFYTRVDKVASYIGGRAGVFLNQASGSGSDTTDWLFGLAFGGEYYLHPKFSLGVEAQANFTISDDNSARFSNPGGLNVNTASAIFASIYF